LDYWESGLDLGLSRDMFDSFLKYQKLLINEFERLRKVYDFDIVDGTRSLHEINVELRNKIEAVLQGS